MPQSPDQAIAAWKKADEQAQAAELTLKTAWDRYRGGEGPASFGELMADVSRARSNADDKLTIAMMLIGSAVQNRPSGLGSSPVEDTKIEASILECSIRFELFAGTNGQWHWQLISPRGDILAIGGQRYPDREAIVRAIEEICGGARTAEIWEIGAQGVVRVR